ncbi:hypothetical protein K432DRAFT_443269 [Lepidopterella palustris CBS 459.81]|uniref:Uncharacterized protein n=1 Tax=Lepidopterella palustris CBS 459.81 TaxID=1314670 RepID=A0A8E2EA71_9PEZI|nr:hypothetical protein K432DRAFT_443269 [Lepidopterella palustris CBS 459.81]
MAKRIFFSAGKDATGVEVTSAVGGGPSYILLRSTKSSSALAPSSPPNSPWSPASAPKKPYPTSTSPSSRTAQASPEYVGPRPHPRNLRSLCRTLATLNSPSFAPATDSNYLTFQAGVPVDMGAKYLGWENIPPALHAALSQTAKEALKRIPLGWPDFEHVIGSFAPFTSLNQTKYLAFDEGALFSLLLRGNASIASNDTNDPSHQCLLALQRHRSRDDLADREAHAGVLRDGELKGGACRRGGDAGEGCGGR